MVYTSWYQTHRKEECKNPMPYGAKKAGKLTRVQQRIFDMREKIQPDGNRMTHREIAAELGLSRQTVEGAYARAKRRLGGLYPESVKKVADQNSGGRHGVQSPLHNLRAEQNAKPIEAYEFVRNKLLRSLIERVRSKEKIEAISNEELMAMLQGCSKGIALEIEYMRGGQNGEAIKLNVDPRMFEVKKEEEMRSEESGMGSEDEDEEEESGEIEDAAS